MAGVAGRSGTNKGKDKPFRDALRIEAALADNGEPSPAHKGSLRWIARRMLERSGDETAAAKEVADRLDGKVAQPVGGDDDLPPVTVQTIARVIVDPAAADSNGEGLPPAS